MVHSLILVIARSVNAYTIAPFMDAFPNITLRGYIISAFLLSPTAVLKNTIIPTNGKNYIQNVHC